MYKTVLFGLDGMLLDMLEGAMGAVNRVMQKHGFPMINVPQFRDIYNNGARNLIALAANQTEPVRIEQMLSEFVSEYASAVRANIYTGVYETLKELKKVGIKLAVFSNKVDCIALNQLKMEGIYDEFDFIQTDDGKIKHKPAPDGIQRIMCMTGFLSEETLMVGDSVPDLNAAQKAKVDFCFSAYEIGLLKEWQKYARYSIYRFSDLYPIVVNSYAK